MNADHDLKLRLLCGLLASVARLAPVPFLDDVLRERALRLMVSRTLEARGRTYRSKAVSPLYSDSRGCVDGCVVFVLLSPIQLLLFPFRKVLVWLTAAKHLATDLSEAVLLGRALDVTLSAGRLPEGASAAALLEEAALIRRAFESAIAGTDIKLLRTSLKAALGSVAGLSRAALAALRRLRKGEGGGAVDPIADLSKEDRAVVEQGTSRVRDVLESPEVKAMLEAFDRRFEENLVVLTERAAGG